MNSSKLKRAAAIGLGTLVIPVGMAVTGAAPALALAGPDLCVSGPYGYAKACIERPDWPGPWRDHGPHGKGRGHHYDD